MSSRTWRALVALACLAPFTFAPALARAQAPKLQPPTPIEPIDPEYPAEAAGLEATVVLELVIDAEGRVTSAKVIDPVGHGFDEAAQTAAMKLRFAPATKDGAPIPSKIRWSFAFTPKPEPEPEPEPEPHPESAPAPAPAPATELTVHGDKPSVSESSAEAVTVVRLKQAQKQSADLGEVMARTQGVAVRRSGGLGSGTRFSLNGLYDDQIRFFVDGVPLDAAGFAFGVASVPVNLIDRVEIYRGVVPIRFGADALGGAVNLVTPARWERRASASYQVGSFGTYRFALDARDRHEKTGLVAGISLLFDHARNDYPVEVEVPDARGRLSPATVTRFHDGYRAWGGSLEAGVVERSWARKLLLRLFSSTYDKELQHNPVMTVPYGEVSYGESVRGATLRYEHALARGLELEAIVSGSRRTIDFVDRGAWVWDWLGRRVREHRVAGEIDAVARDRTTIQDTVLARATLSWTVAPKHVVRLGVSPTFTTRKGDERVETPGERDPLNARRELFTLVSGLEYQVDAFGDRLENVLFAKGYLMRARSDEILPGSIVRPLASDAHDVGFGDALRLRVTPWLLAKASYEYARRLPRPDEIFGNGILVVPNLTLEPEISHNGNVGPRVELKKTPIGDLTIDVNSFVRDSDRLIVLLGNDRFYSYQNVYRARARGVESALAWTSPERHASVDGTFTWQDVRNASSEGAFADFAGDRIPNRPWMFGSWGARLRAFDLMARGDVLEPFYVGRWVHEVYRGWESQGLRQFKQSVPSQTTHSIGASYSVHGDHARITSTFEVQNLTDAKVYDFFGVQRPGRAVFFKVVGEI